MLFRILRPRRMLRELSASFNRVFLALLLCADVVFLLVHVANEWLPEWLPSPPSLLFSLDEDGGYSEVFQYIKEYWIAIAFVALYWRTREGLYGAWALLFGYLLLDDALTIHEWLGRTVARRWHYVPALGLRARDFGELTISVVAGSAFLVLIACFHLRGSREARNVSRDLAVLFGLLVFFGVVVDVAHSALDRLVRGSTVLEEGAVIVEDGGELITMSIVLSYVVHLLEGRGHVPGLVWQSTIGALTGRPGRRATARR